MPTIALIALIFALFALDLIGILALAKRLLVQEQRLAAWEKSERLTPQRLAELAEVNEAVKRAEELLLKVNRREIANAKRRDGDGSFASGAETVKDALRRKAGLRAGEAPRHA